VKGPAWGASTGEIAHNAPSPPARDGLGAALRQRQRRQDLLDLFLLFSTHQRH